VLDEDATDTAEAEAAERKRAAAIMGHKGGRNRMARLTRKQRQLLSRLGNAVRWQAKRPTPPEVDP